MKLIDNAIKFMRILLDNASLILNFDGNLIQLLLDFPFFPVVLRLIRWNIKLPREISSSCN